MKACNLILSVFILYFIYACSTAKPSVDAVASVEKTKTEDVAELKAKIDDLNNRIFVMSEQLESLKARTKEENKITKPKSAAEEVIASYTGDAANEKTANTVKQKIES
ncbi:MAG: hypothetical protein WCQ47_08610, partial [bacterium]